MHDGREPTEHGALGAHDVGQLGAVGAVHVGVPVRAVGCDVRADHLGDPVTVQVAGSLVEADVVLSFFAHPLAVVWDVQSGGDGAHVGADERMVQRSVGGVRTGEECVHAISIGVDPSAEPHDGDGRLVRVHEGVVARLRVCTSDERAPNEVPPNDRGHQQSRPAPRSRHRHAPERHTGHLAILIQNPVVLFVGGEGDGGP